MKKNGQVTMEWTVVLILAAVALATARGYLKGHLQDSLRKNAEQISQDLYDAGAAWNYTFDPQSIIITPSIKIEVTSVQ